eukprot:1157087-Pelagomonas_calceolata.AAC.8
MHTHMHAHTCFAGPCVPTNTACSSSLVAAHLASHSLRSISQGSADCQAALAAGVNAVLVPRGASAAMTQVVLFSGTRKRKEIHAMLTLAAHLGNANSSFSSMVLRSKGVVWCLDPLHP